MKPTETNGKKSLYRFFYDGWTTFTAWLGKAVRRYNHTLSNIYSPNLVAATGAGIVLILCLITLFLPPYVGVADDGSLQKIMIGAGLGYRRIDLAYPTGAYFVRVYLHSADLPESISTHRLLIRTAMWLDDLFTRDNLFDVRFLALLYLLFYLPAVFLTIRGVVSRVKNPMEATFLMILCAIVLGDASYTAYFNSLYPEAMWQVFTVFCLGFCMAVQANGRGWTYTALIGLTLAGSILVLTEAHCGAAGLVLVFFCLRQIRLEDGTPDTAVLAVICAVVLAAVSVVSLTAGFSRFTETSKMHAMTNGVLLRSQNPEKTLAEFGIEPRFETLTDISGYADYPYTLSGNPELHHGFLDRYSTAAIAFYYVRHPSSLIALLEQATAAAIRTLRSYIGNYEVSLGLPERARNPLFVQYSNFKANTLPSTLGFLAILGIVYSVLFRTRKNERPEQRRWTLRERQIMLDTFFCILAMGMADMIAVIMLSGTAELERYQMLYGNCINGILLLFMAEILHHLKLVSDEE